MHYKIPFAIGIFLYANNSTKKYYFNTFMQKKLAYQKNIF